MNDMWLIYSADENWGIGKDGDLLVKIPEDLKDRFKVLTINKTVVMGKNTLLSLPGKKGLPARTNFVLTKNKNFICENATIVNSLRELFDFLDRLSGDIFVIGGGNVYDQLRPYCKGAFVTKIMEKYDADTFVENLDKRQDWEIIKESEVMRSSAGVCYKYVDYINNNVIKYGGE